MSDTLAVPRLTLGSLDLPDYPRSEWQKHSWEISLAIVRSRRFNTARVATGYAEGISGKHYWVCLGSDVYSKLTPILDATLWSAPPFDSDVLWSGSLASGIHRPLGMGYIWDYGYPENSSFREAIRLPEDDLSLSAKYFLARLGPMDLSGWKRLMLSPMQGWPSGEILAAMKEHPQLSGIVPLDLEGMLTSRNPGGLFLG